MAVAGGAGAARQTIGRLGRHPLAKMVTDRHGDPIRALIDQD
jgi:hypothetical protein